MKFRYLRDPVFLCCAAAYGVNHELERWSLSPRIAQSYLNDLICIPFWVPFIVQAARWLRLRNHDDVPDVLEIWIPVILISSVFEVLLPNLQLFRGKATADPFDVFCYVLGALAAERLWHFVYCVGESVQVPRAG